MRLSLVRLIHSLELGVETADDAVAEAVGLDLRPVIDLVGRNVLGIDGLVVGSPGIGSAGTDHAHHLVVLVGDGNLGCQIAHGVDLLVEELAGGGIGDGAVLLIEFLYLVEIGLFGRIVLGAEVLGALEHEMLEVMGEAGGLLGVVLSTYAHCDVGLDAGLFLVDGHIDLEPVVQGVDLGFHGVSGNGFIFSATGDAGSHHGHQAEFDKLFKHIGLGKNSKR